MECLGTPANVGKVSNCRTYANEDIVGCFCIAKLQEILAENINIDWEEFGDLAEGVCQNFFIGFSIAIVVNYSFVVVVLLFNVLVRRCMVWAVSREIHPSIDKEETSLAAKVFMGIFFNLAFSAVLVYGKLNIANKPAVLDSINLLNGEYDDLSRDWYGNVGSFIILTFFLESILVLIPTCSKVSSRYTTPFLDSTV